MTTSALSGRRVIELGTMLAAPFAAQILAQLGAEIIKVEPTTGDPTRTLVRGGPSGTFIGYNHSKKSVGLDLSRAEGRSVFERLLATADVILHNLSPGAARRLGVSWESCSEANPLIVYCHIRGYGAGPLENELASNPVAEAATGVMEANRINGRPSRLGPSYHDQFAGSYAVIRILAALVQPSAQNRHIELGLYETGLHIAGRDLVGVQLKTHLLGKAEREPHGEFSMPGYGAYETADGRWMYLLMLTDGHWNKFCRALGLKAGDESLATVRQRRKQREHVDELVRQAVHARSWDQLAGELTAAGFGFTEVIPLEQVLEQPQARQPGKLTHLQFRGLNFDVPAFPGGVPRDGGSSDGEPPQLGQHSVEVLKSLGFGNTDIDALVAAGTVAIPQPNEFAWAPVRGAGERKSEA